MDRKAVLVIFDLISTLTDAGPRYVRAFTEVCAQHDYRVPDPERLKSMLGEKTLSEIIDHFIGPMAAQDKAAFMAACNRHCDSLLCHAGLREELYPYARDAIRELRLRGATLGIFTGTRAEAVELQLAHHGLKDEFDPAYIRGKDNDRDAGKENILLKSEQLHSIVTAYRAKWGNDAAIIVVGDSGADARAAENLGLFFVGFAADDKKMRELSNANVKIAVQHFNDLPNLVDHLLMPDQIGRLFDVAANNNKIRPGVHHASGIFLYKNQL